MSDLTIDGVTISGFAPDVFNYDYNVETGDPIPVAGATLTDPMAILLINQATSLPGAATVVVTSEDGVTTNTYTVNFLYTPGTDATLSDLLVAGITIDGFDPVVYNYSYAVVYNTPTPYVQGIANDPLATIDDTQCLSVPGDAILVVTAEDGVTELIYTVHFYTLATDATLSDLTVDGITIPNFNPTTYYYEVDVFEGHPVPIIDGTTNDPLALLEITQASNIPDDGTIVVTAQDGITELTYIVHFNLITGIYDTDETIVTTYPNPVSNIIYITGIKDAYYIEIINMIGKVVVSEKTNPNLSIKIPFLDSGVYFAIIHRKSGAINSLKFIKK